jgi:hypothetical protein
VSTPAAVLYAFLVVCVWTLLGTFVALLVGRMFAKRRDAEADREWVDICAAVGITPADIRQRWQQQEADNRAELETTLAQIRALPQTGETR